MYCDDGAPIFRDCLFTGNASASGGGLEIYGAAKGARVERCTIAGNTAVGLGGGVSVQDGARAVLDDCWIHDNTGGSGGGLSVSNAQATVLDCRIEGNAADFGGGLCLLSTPALDLQDCVVAGNEAAVQGGGLYAYAAQFTAAGGAVSGNQCDGDGGALWLMQSGGAVTGADLLDNAALGLAGGVYADHSALILRESRVAGNGLAVAVVNPRPGRAEAVDARWCWWGHASGPYHPVTNPGGQGDEVGDHVSYAPWLDLTAAPGGPAAASPRLVVPGLLRPGARIRCVLPSAGTARLSVFDARGRLLAAPLDGWRDAGESVLAWDARDARGRALPSGVYLLRLESGGRVAAARAVLLR